MSFKKQQFKKPQQIVTVLFRTTAAGLLSLFGSTVSAVQSTTFSAENAQVRSHEPAKHPTHAALPEGRTLPEGVTRSWILHRHYSATSGFDQTGKSLNNGFESRVGVSGLIMEYGITNRLSFRMLVPYAYNNDLRMDQGRFRNSSIFTKKYNQKADEAARKLMISGLCGSIQQCRQLIDSGNQTIPFEGTTVLETGETITMPQGVPFRQFIENSILKGATPPLRGSIGLGDAEAGLLFNFHKTENALLSAGLGVRAPTGRFNIPEMRRPISGGVYDVGLRFNADYNPLAGLWLSFQEQCEKALSKATWKRSSLVDNTRFNEADPVDGIENRQSYEKFGIYHTTLLKANYGLGAVIPQLKFLAANIRYYYQHERAVRLGGQERLNGITTARPGSEIQNLGAGVSISGLPYGFPAEFEVNYQAPTAGRNSRLSASILESYVRVYTRF